MGYISTQSIKGIGRPPPNILDFKSVEVELKADPGNHNGPVISDASGTGFTNTGPTGEADDIAGLFNALN
jgi:hypothetical protein